MCNIKELRNLNEIGRVENRGIYKRWILSNPKDGFLIDAYMEKINYCIQDLNTEITFLSQLTNKSIVNIIALTTWISEAAYGIRSAYRKEVIKDFTYPLEDELQEGLEYLRAIRSFVVAHPLTTKEHKKYAMDGRLKCIDIRLEHPLMSFRPNKFFASLDRSGYHPGVKLKSDFYLYGYYKEANSEESHTVYIGCSVADIYRVAELYIDKLYALDIFLKTVRR